MAPTAINSTLHLKATPGHHYTTQADPITEGMLYPIRTSPGLPIRTKIVQEIKAAPMINPIDRLTSTLLKCYRMNPVMGADLLSRLKLMGRLSQAMHLRIKAGHGAVLATKGSLELPLISRLTTPLLLLPSSI